MFQVTALYASLLSFYFIALTFWVVRGRWKFKVGLGSGESKELEKRIRVHGNFAEFIPLALILLALLEGQGKVEQLYLHIFGFALILSRVLHNIGLSASAGTSKGRVYGTGVMIILIVVMALLNILSSTLW